jgi:hypothetical protein
VFAIDPKNVLGRDGVSMFHKLIDPHQLPLRGFWRSLPDTTRPRPVVVKSGIFQVRRSLKGYYCMNFMAEFYLSFRLYGLFGIGIGMANVAAIVIFNVVTTDSVARLLAGVVVVFCFVAL